MILRNLKQSLIFLAKKYLSTTIPLSSIRFTIALVARNICRSAGALLRLTVITMKWTFLKAWKKCAQMSLINNLSNQRKAIRTLIY